MATVTATPVDGTVADLLARLGDIPPERVRMVPTPGQATEEDAFSAESRFNRLCELIDGVLVEKTRGSYESFLASKLAYFFNSYLRKNDVGFVLGPDGMVRLQPGQIREPDVSVFLWQRFPKRIFPPGAALDNAPDLAVEVIRPSNTAGEMNRKRRDYFSHGSHLVWYAYPKRRCVEVFTSIDQPPRTLGEEDSLDGGGVLPGFSLPLRDWFNRVPQASEEPG